MKEIKNLDNYNVGETIKNYNYKNTIKNAIKTNKNDIIKCSLIAGLFASLTLSSGTGIIDSIITFLEYGIWAGIGTSVALSSFEMINKHFDKKIAKREVNVIIDRLERNNVSISKNDLENTIVKEVENTKGTYCLDDNVRENRKKVVNYIAISQKEKLEILKEVIIKTSSELGKDTEKTLYLLNEEDKKQEGIIAQNNELTGKGLSLKYNHSTK